MMGKFNDDSEVAWAACEPKADDLKSKYEEMVMEEMLFAGFLASASKVLGIKQSYELLLTAAAISAMYETLKEAE